jgi:hypothetical protein
MCEKAEAILDEFLAVNADLPAHFDIFLRDCLGFGQNTPSQLSDIRIGASSEEIRRFADNAIKSPEQIDCRRSRRSQVFAQIGQDLHRPGCVTVGGKLLHTQDQTIGGGDTDGGSASHGERLYRFVKLPGIAAFELDKLARQKPLIDKLEKAIDIADPLKRLCDHKANISNIL